MKKPPFEKEALKAGIKNAKINIGRMQECIDKEQEKINEYETYVRLHEEYEKEQ